MNKYIIPICDIDSSQIWIKEILAKSTNDCKEKLMQYIINSFEIEEDMDDYRSFIELMDTNYNVLIGDIKEIDEMI